MKTHSHPRVLSPFACLRPAFLLSRSSKDAVSKQCKGRETGSVGNIPLLEKLEERANVLFNLCFPLPQIDEYGVEQDWVAYPWTQSG